MTGRSIVIAKCSPRRNGNSAALADQVAAGARAAGAEVEVFELHRLEVAPCAACDTCQAAVDQNCIVEDDMQAVYPSLRRAAAVVIASPVYWFTISAQAKLFIDRGFYPLGGPEGHALADKQLALILTYGDSDPFASGAVNALRTFQDMARYLGAEIAGTVCASAMGAGEVREQQRVMDQAYELGRRLGTGT